MSAYLGIEIGGTKLQAAVGDGDGTVFRTVRVAARPDLGREGICRQIERLVAPVLTESHQDGCEVTACGIGFGGPVDAKRGVVLKSHQVAGWNDVRLIEWFQNRFRMPTALGNDSDLAGWAEALFGAGKGFSPVVYMNIGSGIGGAHVVDGELYQGQGIGAMEIGHLRITPASPGLPWNTLESLCSGWALEAQAQAVEGLEAGANAGVIAMAAANGNESARLIWSAAIERLGVAVANVISLLHPQRVVIGGGVALIGDALFTPRTEVNRQVFEPFLDGFKIVRADLGEVVVLHGALRLAKSAAA